MSCRYVLYRTATRRFMENVEDHDLFRRVGLHEAERVTHPWNRQIGSEQQARRLIWMREVRTQIRERRLDA